MGEVKSSIFRQNSKNKNHIFQAGELDEFVDSK